MPGPKRKKKSKEESVAKKPKLSKVPARTLKAREKQLAYLATKEAEKRIKNGTATSQMIIYFSKMGSEMDELARKKLESENVLLQAKTEALASAKRVEELYEKALDAMREYSGQKKTAWDEEEDD